MTPEFFLLLLFKFKPRVEARPTDPRRQVCTNVAVNTLNCGRKTKERSLLLLLCKRQTAAPFPARSLCTQRPSIFILFLFPSRVTFFLSFFVSLARRYYLFLWPTFFTLSFFHFLSSPEEKKKSQRGRVIVRERGEGRERARVRRRTVRLSAKKR